MLVTERHGVEAKTAAASGFAGRVSISGFHFTELRGAGVTV